MNKNFKIGAAVVVAIAVAALLIWRPWAGTASPDSVRIATNLPLSGFLSTYGEPVREGGQMALDDLESSDPKRAKLEFDWQDNASDPKAAVSVMQQQYLRAPDLYVSGVKPQAMAIADQISAKGTPHFIWIFDPFINKKSKNNLRTWVSYKIEAPVYIDFILSKKARKVAIVHFNLPHAIEEFEQIVLPALKKEGIDSLVESFNPGKEDFKEIAVKFRDYKPDVIVMNGFQEDMVRMVRAFRPFGLLKDGNNISCYDLLDAAKLLGADEMEGLRVVAPRFETRASDTKIAEWRDRFEKRFKKAPLYTHAYAYDMVLVINDAAKRLKLPATSEQWLDAIKKTDIAGVTGPLRFDDGGDLMTPVEAGVYRGGKLLPDRP